MITPGSANPLLMAGGDANAPIVAPDGCCSADPYTVKGSVRLRQTVKGILNRTFPVAGNLKKWTFSTWIKRGILNANNTNGPVMFQAVFGGQAGYNDSSFTTCYIHTSGGLTLSGYQTLNWKLTNQKVEDTTAWYHWLWSIDTDNANAADRVRIYINGTKATFATDGAIGVGQTFGINTAAVHTLGYDNIAAGYWIDAYYAETHFIDGQALDATSFGEFCLTTSQWNPKKYTGAYGTNGFYLDFQDPAQIGKDVSGNNNHWTPHNIDTAAPGTQATYDVMKDSPSRNAALGVGNYAVISNIAAPGYGPPTTKDGNLNAHLAASGAYATVTTNHKGKFYWEYKCLTGTNQMAIGFSKPPVAPWGDGVWWRNIDGFLWIDNVKSISYGNFAANDVVGVAVDADNNSLAFYVNGVKKADQPYARMSEGGFAPVFWSTYAAVQLDIEVNFGQRPFSFPLAGYLPICTAYLDDTALPAGIRCARGAIT